MKKKKNISLLAVLVLMLAFCACSKQKPTNDIIAPKPVKEVQFVRAFYNVDSTPEYHPIQRILTTEDLHQKLLETARRDMIIFKEKYKTLVEIQSVISAIDESLSNVN